jgi:tetratricopeptide (TPR) repeat protein
MKKLSTIAMAIVFAVATNAQVKMPAPSPTQTIKQEFAMGSIELKYSRPAAKGRVIFGDLVPYNKLWRTGANAATSIYFSEPVEIKGKKVDTGKYVLYTIPGIDSWEIILNKGLNNWGIDGYKESEDVVRVKVDAMKMKTKIENFTMQFADIKPESCELHIYWENTGVAIPIAAKIKDKLKAQLEDALNTAEKKPYWLAAQFYNEYEKNLPKALEYATKAAEANPKAYWVLLYKAKIQAEMGDKTGALESSNKSLALAKDDGNDDYVKMNEDLQKKLK